MADYYDKDADSDAEKELKKDFVSLKESHIFLVDASPSMFEPANVKDELDVSAAASWFTVAITTIIAFVKSHIISASKDRLAIILYGTREKRNSKGMVEFERVFVPRALDEPEAKLIRELEELQDEEEFQRDIGSDSSGAPNLLFTGLWAASLQFARTPRALQRVSIWTRSDNPCPTEAEKGKLLNRISELHDNGTRLELFPMVTPKSPFNMAVWQEVLPPPPGADPDDPYPEGSGLMQPSIERLKDIQRSVRRKAHRKRVLARGVQWHLGPGFALTVGLYSMFQRATRGAFKWVEGPTSEVLQPVSVLVDAETGGAIARVTKFIYPKPDPRGSEVRDQRFPPLVLDLEVTQALSQGLPRGLRLLGFKPASAIAAQHQLQHSLFLYPDERTRGGSTAAFIALHAALLRSQKVAIVAFSRTDRSEPRLAAVFPQAEGVDEEGEQVEPPGMNLVVLPYSDDLREPEKDASFRGTAQPDVQDAQVAAGRQLVQRLSADIGMGELANPALQRHYQVLEAVALGEPIPDDIEDESELAPWAPEQLQLIDEFKAALNWEAIEPKKMAAGSKRRLSDADAQALKDSISGTDWKGLASSGELRRLTIAKLKEYLKANSLPQSGKKADLAARIEQHLAR